MRVKLTSFVVSVVEKQYWFIVRAFIFKILILTHFKHIQSVFILGFINLKNEIK